MGRGLSTLQRSVLEQAFASETVYRKDIFEDCGLIVCWTDYKPARTKWDLEMQKKYPDWRLIPRVHFSPETDGPRYFQVMSSVSRSFRRLEERGLLVKVSRGEYEITEEGRKFYRDKYGSTHL